MPTARSPCEPLVLVDTTNLTREEWLSYRRLGIGGSDAVYLPRHFFHEEEVARRVSEILVEPAPLMNITEELAQVVRELGISLSKKQADAVKMSFRYNLSIITGSPGTGKTTVLKTVIELFRRVKKNGKILFTAPTGRASRRMAESTGCSGAKTLHSALGLMAGDEADNTKDNKKPLVIEDSYFLF